jgi:hypothetical protein
MSGVDSLRRIALRHKSWYEDRTPLEHIKIAHMGRMISQRVEVVGWTFRLSLGLKLRRNLEICKAFE